tara:strand:+ start:4595 stop:6778 length:2184 start_codon:yes stop_codon:yes gene_type:complete
MPTNRQTYPIEFRGGLITNMSPLQQGINQPGSARILRNYEPSVEGGYRRIEGYDKYDSNIIPPYGAPVVHGDSQSGTTLIVANIRKSPEAGDVFSLSGGAVNGASQTGTSLIADGFDVAPSANDTFTIAGDTTVYTVSAATALSGTESTLTISPAITVAPADNAVLSFRYTISAGAVTFNDTTNRATLTIDQTMVVNPSNGDSLTFISTTSKYLALGCGVFLDSVIVAKNESVYETTGSGYSLINIPSYGTVLVNGASQSGSSLVVDGLDATPQIGDIFKIAGVDLIYTLTATPTVTSGGATLAIDPALDSSPADNAAITFLSTSRETAGKTRFSRYNYTGTEKIAIVDGTNVPALYDRNIFTALNDAPSDVDGAEFVVNFKNQLFFGKNNLLTFTAPYTDNDFTAAAGSGTISVGADITGLVVFRQQLIIFTESSIFQLTGNTISDFQLQPITRDIGCVDEDTIQEVGGDVMFLGPDGLRLLSGTDRIGDFGLAVVSKPIQKETTEFITTNTSFTSVVIREKSQYRLLGYNTNITQENAQGILGTQMAGQGGEGMAWAELRGIRAYVADSRFYQNTETIVFANDDGYLYQMENGNSFDGNNILTTFATPFMPINDPRVRKTFYKMFLYTDPQGSVSFETSLKLDFDQKNSVQPTQISFNNTTGQVAFYGQATFGSTAVFSSKLQTLFETQLIGSGFVVSLQYTSDSTDPPFSLDAITLEYGTNTRR